MRQLLFLACFLILGCQTLPEPSSDDEETVNTVVDSFPNESSYPFPEAWLGTYKGDLHIMGTNKVVQRIPMQLSLTDLDSAGCVDWDLRYRISSDNEDIRRYILLPEAPEKGHYLLDERNSIQLKIQFYYDELVSIFEVADAQLTVRYQKINNRQILFTVHSSNLTRVLESGNDTTAAGEYISPARSYQVVGVQRAILTKEAE